MYQRRSPSHRYWLFGIRLAAGHNTLFYYLIAIAIVVHTLIAVYKFRAQRSSPELTPD